MSAAALRSTIFAAVAAAALTAGPAAAKDFCTYGVSGCAPSGGVQDALEAAAKNPGADRVLIGSGTWIGNFHLSGPDTIEGTAPGTTLTQSDYGPGANYPYTLSVTGATVRDLHIKLAAGYVPKGLELLDGASAQNVTIDGPGADQATGLNIGTNASFSGSVDLGQGNLAVAMGPGSTLVDAHIAGAPAIGVQAGTGTALIRRSTIVRHASTAIGVGSGALTIEDSLVDARAPGAGAAITTFSAMAAAVHSVDLRNVTLLGHGEEAGSLGIAASSYMGETVNIKARDTVVANFGSNALSRSGAGTSNLALDNVDVFPASAVKEQGAGQLTQTAVIYADPLFAADGFTPAAGSPLIDAGTDGPLAADESATDLAGGPRIVAYGCGAARRDIGAIEAVGGCTPPPAPATGGSGTPAATPSDVTAPKVTKLRIVHRRSVRFALTEAARVTVRIVGAHHRAIVLRRSAAAGAVRLRLKHPLHHARYAIRVIATDAAGNRSSIDARLTVR